MDQNSIKTSEEEKGIVLASENDQNMELYKQYLEQLKEERKRFAEQSSSADEFHRQEALDSLMSDIDSLESFLDNPDDKFVFPLKEIQGMESDVQSLQSHLSDISDGSDGNERVSTLLAKSLREIDESIASLQADIESLISEYESSQKKLSSMYEEDKQDEDNSLLLSEEEQQEREVTALAKRDLQTDISARLLRELDREKRREAFLKRKRQKWLSDLEKADALDLTVAEYREIENAVNRDKVEEVLMAKKGISDIFHKPAQERTEEERELLREVRDDIFREIHSVQEENDVSAVDAIELVYHLDSHFSREEKPRFLQVSAEDIHTIQDSIDIQPEKVVGDKSEMKTHNPGKSPSDMKDTTLETDTSFSENQDTDQEAESMNSRRGFREKIALYRNMETGDIYVREYGLSRFGIQSNGTSVMINGVQCFPISQADARVIIERQDNDNSPYEVVSREIESREVQSIDAKESLQEMKYIHDLLEYTKDNNIDIYQYYLDFANQYRNNPDFVPQDFELDNPFLDESSYQGLRDSKEALINQYFATVMNKVIKAHLSEYEKQTSKDLEQEMQTSVEEFEKEVQNLEENHPIDTSLESTRGMERIVLYRDSDTSQAYVSKPTLNRFQISSIGDGVTIDGREYFPILEGDATYIESRQDNDLSPYVLDERVASLENEANEVESFISPLPNENAKRVENSSTIDRENVEYIPIFRATNDENRLYADKICFEKFGIEPRGQSVDIQGIPCYLIHDDQMDVMQRLVDVSENPKLVFKYNDGLIDKKENSPQEEVQEHDKVRGEVHYQTIIKKLTEGLNSLSRSNAKKYRASNISISQAGRELQTGNFLYNVFGFLPGIVTLPLLALKKLASKLTLSIESKRDYEELQRRLNEDLTEEELEVLFRDYRGSNAKADNNPSINSFIADRMRRYVLEKVDHFNEIIREEYASFFSYLKEIEVLDARLDQDDLSPEEKESFMAEKDQLMRYAAECACKIDYYRNEGIDLLSGCSLHAFEEDMKAVDSKMSYIGYRFAKSGDFDHETQALLAEFGQGFNDAIASGDMKGIVENFIKYEACYSTNTDIRKSIFGERSVGSKYYTPLIEEFNYRDDPFVRNLLSTIAISTAVVSAANAYHVHKIETEQLLHQQKEDIARVNEINDAAIGRARRVGNNITGYHDTMMHGLESQIRHNTDEAALGLERSALDATSTPAGWNLGDEYSALDHANHVFYNGFHQEVSSHLNGIASSYANGSINQAEALRQIVDVANASSETLNGVVGDCLSVLQEYAKTHPDFDLQAIQESMEYIVSNPSAVVDMNNGIVDIMEQAGTLTELSAAHYTALSSLPSDMFTTLISAASAVSLAHHVSSAMRFGLGQKFHYGNDVTDMMDDYLYGDIDDNQEIDDVEETHHTR